MKKLKEKTQTQNLYWDSDNEIVWGELHGNVTTVELAIENIDAQERICKALNLEKTRVLVDMSPVYDISKEAREYFANERTASIQRATALIVKSKLSRAIGNFFLDANKPLTPTKLFTDSGKAIEWLKTFDNK